MASNQYAVDFSPIAQGISTFKKKKYDKRLKGEVDSLIKKRDGLDTTLTGQASKQQQLIDDTPEMDQTANMQDLDTLQGNRLQFQQSKYDELGGLSPKDLQGMSTEAVDKYKARVAVDRTSHIQRKKEDTISTFLRFEALGQDPNIMVDWFNEYEASKWGLPDGVGEFRETTQTHPDTGEPYLAIELVDKKGEVVNTLPKEKFMQFATSSLDPEVTMELSQNMRKGVHKEIVKAKSIKAAFDSLDEEDQNGASLTKVLKERGVSEKEFLNLVGVKTTADTLGSIVNLVNEDGTIEGAMPAVRGGVGGLETTKPKQVVAKAGAGSGANKRVELLLKVREANAKQDKQSAEALYREITSQYGNEDMIAIDKSGNIIPNTKLMKQELDTDIEEYTLLVEQNDDPADKEYLIQLQSWKNAIKEAKARGLRTTDTNDNIMDVVLQYIDASSGGDVTGLKGDRQASPSGMGQPIEARGTSKSRGSTKKTAGGKVVPALEPSVSMPQAMGMQTSPPAVFRPDARAKRTQGKLSPEAKAARIKELNKKLKGLI